MWRVPPGMHRVRSQISSGSFAIVFSRHANYGSAEAQEIKGHQLSINAKRSRMGLPVDSKRLRAASGELPRPIHKKRRRQ